MICVTDRGLRTRIDIRLLLPWREYPITRRISFFIGINTGSIACFQKSLTTLTTAACGCMIQRERTAEANTPSGKGEQEQMTNTGANEAARPKAYAAWTKDADLRFKSTSGGIFSELALFVVSEGGYVCGAEYAPNHRIAHRIVHDASGIERLRQSKYAQSDMLDNFAHIGELLQNDETVAFCGTPCQVAGLKMYLGKEPSRLITIDFICRGVNSPRAYQRWLREIEEKTKCRAVNVWFKYKDRGWKASPKRTRVLFEDGHSEVFDQDTNAFMAGYLGPNLYIRKSCGACRFKGLPRESDITLADFWGADPRFDSDQGTSLVLVHTEKGKRLWESISGKIEAYAQDLSEIFAQNPMFDSSVEISPRSGRFLKSLDGRRFSDMVKKYSKLSLGGRIRRKLSFCIKSIWSQTLSLHQNKTPENPNKGSHPGYVKLNRAQIPLLYRRREDCTGCSACYTVCPRHAIHMRPEQDGFLYPRIAPEMCVRCQRCVAVCPMKQQTHQPNHPALSLYL